jgi:hypothetical protein
MTTSKKKTDSEEKVGGAPEVPPEQRNAPKGTPEGPAHVYAERKATPKRVEMGETYTDGIMPGKNARGLVLSHHNYITPDPRYDYKFCSLRDTHISRNKVNGWSPTRVDGKEIVAGRMQLCQRPKEIGQQRDAEHLEMVERRKASQSAAAQAKKHNLSMPVESESVS